MVSGVVNLRLAERLWMEYGAAGTMGPLC